MISRCKTEKSAQLKR